MQNLSGTTYLNTSKIINIKSEILCREAEDDFFYFNKINTAYKKLIQAVDLTPFHLKSLILLADVSFIKGYIKKAISLYKRAEEISGSNPKIPAAIANCYLSLDDYSNAILYCNKALEHINSENYSLYSQIVEIKMNALMNQRNYKEAYITFIQAQNFLDNTSLKMIYNINYEKLNEKINLQKKLQKSKLKIV